MKIFVVFLSCIEIALLQQAQRGRGNEYLTVIVLHCWGNVGEINVKLAFDELQMCCKHQRFAKKQIGKSVNNSIESVANKTVTKIMWNG